MGNVIAGDDFHIEHGKRRVLLVNPPVYDLRLDWARWQQPCGLLRLGATLKERGADVRLLDFLVEGTSPEGRVTRRQVQTVPIGNDQLTLWCFGLPWPDIARRVRQAPLDAWQPDEVWITSLTSFWWRGAQEVIKRARYDWWPHARIVLGGTYPTLYPQHAAANCEADLIVSGRVAEAATQPDWRFYEAAPPCAGIYLYGSADPDHVVDSMAHAVRRGIHEFAFFDEEIPGPDPERFDFVLETIARRKLKLRLVILGNLNASDVTMYRATLLHAAGLAEVFLRWDPGLNGNLLPYYQAADFLQTFGGLKPRDGSLSAIVHAGWPGENVQDTAAHLLHLAHAVGSVTVFPHQITAQDGVSLGISEPDQLNGKLFPFAYANGARFADYADLLRLAATLNSKYRDVTFDFLGNDLVARMVRSSIRRNAWQPAPEANGTRIGAEKAADKAE